MQSKKEILSVCIDKCLETIPCQHEVSVQYKDGTEKKKLSDAPTIARKYAPYLDASLRGHFFVARKPSRAVSERSADEPLLTPGK